MIKEILYPIPIPAPLGGNLALDFTNTAEFRGDERFIDFLKSYIYVLSWGWQLRQIDDRWAEQMYRAATDEAATVVFRQALDFREALYNIFLMVLEGNKPDLAPLNTVLTDALAHRRVAATNAGFAWEWHDESGRLDGVLWPIALAAADLLASESLGKVRKCPNCGWLFVDTSRNRSRRWCSMDLCGSQVKSRRQYERKLGKKED
jgi:predicted RNA-binding Zn ribbon-like protein